MKLQILTHELQVGDVWANRKIIHIEKPTSYPLKYSYMITLSDGDIVTSSAQSEWLIERDIERISQ